MSALGRPVTSGNSAAATEGPQPLLGRPSIVELQLETGCSRSAFVGIRRLSTKPAPRSNQGQITLVAMMYRWVACADGTSP